MNNNKTETIIFGGGCFWCTEAIFTNIKGVYSVVSGYAGGNTENPTYNTIENHAEVIKIEYNPEKIKIENLLEIFFATHDPTTLNRQGNDIGTQYRSVIFYTNNEQKERIEDFVQKMDNKKLLTTEIKPLEKFYKAEEYHQDYYYKNKSAPYCEVIINPKLDKLQKQFKKLLKNEE